LFFSEQDIIQGVRRLKGKFLWAGRTRQAE